MLHWLCTMSSFTSLRSKEKKKKAEQENICLFYTNNNNETKKTKKIKDNPIDVIRFVTRVGKDSLCSSFPSLEKPKLSGVSVRTNN